jgi:CRP-like cAMP-binding protein/Fe-S-cluster-containing hydrogenase component 2
MVLFNKLKVEDAVSDYELMLQAHNVTIASGWTLDQLAENLTGLELFTGVNSADLRRLLMKSTLRFLVPGEELCAEGAFLERLCVVLSGGLEQFSRAPGGGAVTIVRLAPGSFFGEGGIQGQAPEPFGVVAKDTSIVLMAPKVAVLELMERSPAFGATFDAIYARHALWSHVKSPGALGTLPESALTELIGGAELSLITADEALMRQGEAPREFFVVRSGFLRVTQHDGPQPRTLVYLRPGEVFGLLSLLRGEQQNAYSITAATRSEVIRFRREALSSVLNKHPEVRAALTQAAIAAEQLTRAKDVGRSPMAGERPSLVPDQLVEQGIAGGREVLVVDQNLCTGCGNCIASCERRHGYSRLALRGQQVDNYLFPTACRHCEDPTCLLCSVNGIIRLPSGEIKIVEENCIGCGACAQRCPYGNISMHAVSEKKHGFWFNLLDLLSSSPQRGDAMLALEPEMQQVAVKCDLCADHSDYACVNACPVGAAFRVDPVAAFGRSQ